MFRAFDGNEKRKTASLDGEWYFITDANNIGESSGYTSAIPEGCKKTYVPSVWNTDLGLLEYCGVAWYFRKFTTESGSFRLQFGAVMTQADVWVDGEHKASHYGGYTAFSVELPELTEGEHLIAVKVDNGFDHGAIPAKMVDWYHYGGIIRSVILEEMKGICILSSQANYTLDTATKTAELRFTVILKNYGTDGNIDGELKIKLNGSELITAPVTVPELSECYFISENISLMDVDLWSPDSPILYTLDTETKTDGLRDRIGFRTVDVKTDGVYLNGKLIRIDGVCRHEEHPDFGQAFPEALMERDLDIIKNMNANAIRGSHYPNSQYFVDLMDECGVLFWSEIPIWGVGYTAEMLGDPLFIERANRMITEMADQYGNHPSIIIWGIHNEIPSDNDNAVALSELLYNNLKKRNDGRIVTYAANHPFTDRCVEYCDIICINKYNGWYGENIESWSQFLADYREHREKIEMSHKPVIISEFGAAAIYGHHTFDDIKWTEEYQARLFDHTIGLFHEDDMVVGTYIWQYCDIRTCEEMGLNRARGFNNKGVVNEYRRPKMAYNAVKRRYSEK